MPSLIERFKALLKESQREIFVAIVVATPATLYSGYRILQDSRPPKVTPIAIKIVTSGKKIKISMHDDPYKCLKESVDDELAFLKSYVSQDTLTVENDGDKPKQLKNAIQSVIQVYERKLESVSEAKQNIKDNKKLKELEEEEFANSSKRDKLNNLFRDIDEISNSSFYFIVSIKNEDSDDVWLSDGSITLGKDNELSIELTDSRTGISVNNHKTSFPVPYFPNYEKSTPASAQNWTKPMIVNRTVNIAVKDTKGHPFSNTVKIIE